MIDMAEKYELQPGDEEMVQQATRTLLEHRLKKEQKYLNEQPTGYRPITEKELEGILDNMIKMEFDTEDVMIKFFKNEFKKITKDSDFRWEAKRNNKPNVSNTEKQEIDLKDREFDRGGRSWSLRRYVLTKTELYRQWDMQLQSVGRYPLGFRHYENYVNYRTVFPEATIEDYMKDMNRECTFAEFLNIMKAFITQRTRDNRYRLKFQKRRQPLSAMADEEKKRRIDNIVQKFLAT